MKHGRNIAKLGRTTDHRMVMLKNQVTTLFLHGKLITTEPKARATMRIAEKTLTAAKQNDLAAKKSVRRTINDKIAFKKIFEEYAPKYADRKGGCFSIVKLPPRRGDGAPMAVITFMDVEQAD